MFSGIWMCPSPAHIKAANFSLVSDLSPFVVTMWGHTSHVLCKFSSLWLLKDTESGNMLRNVENWQRDVAADFALVAMRCRVALAST